MRVAFPVAWATAVRSSRLRPALAFMFVAAAACGGQKSADGAGANEPVELASTGDGPPGLANRTGMPVTGQAVAADDDDEDSKDYWKNINFDRSNFEEVRQMVKKRYYDAGFDEVWSFAQAASFALSSNEDRQLILMPESFYLERKDNPDEKGYLKGKMMKLSPSDNFVLLAESKEKDKVEEKRKRLSDDEIRKLRDQQMERSAKLRAAWDATKFGQKEFDRIMDALPGLMAGAEKDKAAADKAAGDKDKDKAHPKSTFVWTMKAAWIAAGQGFLYSLDPHSSLMAKTAWDDSQSKTQDSSFEGIGAVLTQRPDSDYTIVESPIQGQPAVKAGIRAGDMIIAVDGKDIKGESLSKVVSRIRGPGGTEVVLTIQREGEPDNKKVSIKRTKIAMKNVQGDLVPSHPDTAYIKVTGYVRTTDDDLVAEVQRLEALTPGHKLRGLILDLRNNSGGLLTQGIQMADRFLKSGIVVAVKNRNSSEDEEYRAVAGDTWEMPLVVLVNDGTASAAEIVASALQDNQRAVVVGDRTFGKASVQTLFSPLLQDDYYIKMTVARYYAPSGRTLQVTGVKPDITVPPEFNGKLPLGFREENLSGHLTQLDGDYVSASAAQAERTRACAEKSGIAKKLHDADPNPAIKFDWQLMYGADILECTIAEHTASGQH